MICEVGKDWYPLPEKFFALYDAPLVAIETRDKPGYAMRLLQLAPEEMSAKREATDESRELRATPRYFAIIGANLWLHPMPDKPYVVLTRYHTHPKVW
jgi:hypothetical protein